MLEEETYCQREKIFLKNDFGDGVGAFPSSLEEDRVGGVVSQEYDASGDTRDFVANTHNIHTDNYYCCYHFHCHELSTHANVFSRFYPNHASRIIIIIFKMML